MMKLVKLSIPREVVLLSDPALALPVLPEKLEGEDAAAHAAKVVAALEPARAAYARYLESYDRSHLVLRDGARPMVFKVLPLTRDQAVLVASCGTGEACVHCGHGDGERGLTEIAYSVQSIDGLAIDDDKGQPVEQRVATPQGKRLRDEILTWIATARGGKLYDELLWHCRKANGLTAEVAKSD